MAKLHPGAAARDIIVIGTSAGGVQVLQGLVSGLLPTLPAAIFVVMHISPVSHSLLPDILTKAGALPASQARRGQPIETGHIYVAPPDHHLLLSRQGRITVSRRGPKENGFRPAVDPLFRTAARTYGRRVIGIVLTGGLDDGTIGLSHIKEHGGVAVVQDPAEAIFPSMPRSAIRHVDVDYIAAVADMPALLRRLTDEPLPEGAPLTDPVDDERPDIAESGNAMLLAGTRRGPPTAVTCPECGGTLWELRDHALARYECHVGHSYTADALLEGKNAALESTLWVALRALEENAELHRRMALRLSDAPRGLRDLLHRCQRQADESEARAAVLRTLLGDGREARRLAAATRAESEAVKAKGNEDRPSSRQDSAEA